MSGCVHLVGAGCGTAELLTLRAKALLDSAEVIVTDALVDETVRALFPSTAEVVSVGKRAHGAHTDQADINALLVEKARAGRNVVRLKGGDPLVFGRGGEEARALREAGIPYDFTPGVSSCLAVPELAGIPLTERGVVRSFHILTAHGADGPLALRDAVNLEGTLVILMGFTRLKGICSELIAAGRDPGTPAAVISEGATPRERTVRGTLATLADLSDVAHLVAPAVIVVGETAADDLTSRAGLPMAGKRVLVVGTDSFFGKCAAKYTALGASVTHALRMEVVPCDWSLPDFKEVDWLVLTSPNGVKVLFEKLRASRTDVRVLPRRIAVLGPGTAAALAERGILATLVPEVHTTSGLASALAGRLAPGARVCLLRSAKGNPALAETLRSAGAQVTDIPTYDTTPSLSTIHYPLSTDILVFGAASGVRAWREAGLPFPENTIYPSQLHL